MRCTTYVLDAIAKTLRDHRKMTGYRSVQFENFDIPAAITGAVARGP